MESRTMDDFEFEVYSRCSENNMPSTASFVPLSADEQRQAEIALAL